MSLLSRVFRPPPPLPPMPPPIDPGVLATIAKAPVFNPSDDEQHRFAAYRLDAIAREIEQRASEGRPAHPEHDKIVAEAMSYAWMLRGVGKWRLEHVASLQTRLLGR